MSKTFRISVFIGGFFLFYPLFIVVGGLSEIFNWPWLRFMVEHDGGFFLFTSPIPFLLIYSVMYLLFKWVHTRSLQK